VAVAETAAAGKPLRAAQRAAGPCLGDVIERYAIRPRTGPGGWGAGRCCRTQRICLEAVLQGESGPAQQDAPRTVRPGS
jgi:hypothetical protein